MKRNRSTAAFLFILALAGSVPGQEAAGTDSLVTVRGRAVDPDGSGVLGVGVSAVPEDQFVNTPSLLSEPQTVTDEQGRYELRVPRGFRGTLVLCMRDYQSCALRIGPVTAEYQVSEGILFPGARLTGRIRDAQGEPLEGVRIRVESSLPERMVSARLLAGATTDEDGIFAVPCVPLTGMRVTATKPGYLGQSVLVSQQTPVDLRMEYVGFVRGRVLDGGQPVAGVRVNGVTVEERVRGEPVFSGEDGSFVLTVPKTGRYRVGGNHPETYESYSSGLLRGPQDGVIVSSSGARRPVPPLVVHAVDAATGERLEEFRASVLWQETQATPAGDLLSDHYRLRKESEGGDIEIRRSSDGGMVVVDAPGYGWEIAPVPEDGDLTVSLGAQAFLAGQVLHAATGQPLPGVSVRAVPSGGRVAGGVAHPVPGAVVTDDTGRFRIEGLRPGEHVVQGFHPQRPASRSVTVETRTGEVAECTVWIPPERWIEFTLEGDLPDSPLTRLRFGYSITVSTDSVSHHAGSWPIEEPLGQSRKFRFGPVGDGRATVSLWRPSRTRLGVGTTHPLGEVDPGDAPTVLTLPDVRTALVRGRVRLPTDVPTERVAVLVESTEGEMFLRWPHFAALGPDGRYEVDLPFGEYFVQLLDLETGVVFHTEPEPLTVAADMDLEIAPEVHWLRIALEPEDDGPVVLLTLQLEMAPPMAGLGRAAMDVFQRSPDSVRAGVRFRLGATDQRWLVPEGTISITALQSFDILRPWATGYAGQPVGSASVDVTDREHEIRLSIPTPPTDEELLKK